MGRSSYCADSGTAPRNRCAVAGSRITPPWCGRSGSSGNCQARNWRQLHAAQQEQAEATAKLAQTQTETQEQQIALEHRDALLAASQARLEQEQRQMEQRRAGTEQQLAALKEEAERLAGALIPDAEALPAALERAA